MSHTIRSSRVSALDIPLNAIYMNEADAIAPADGREEGYITFDIKCVIHLCQASFFS